MDPEAAAAAADDNGNVPLVCADVELEASLAVGSVSDVIALVSASPIRSDSNFQVHNDSNTAKGMLPSSILENYPQNLSTANAEFRQMTLDLNSNVSGVFIPTLFATSATATLDTATDTISFLQNAESSITSSHSIVCVCPPGFGVHGAESDASMKNSDTGSDAGQGSNDAKEESGARSQDKPSVHTFLREFSPSLPPDGLWRHSSLLVSPDTGWRLVRRRVTASTQEKLVNYWENPQMPKFVHLRHSYPSVQGSSPWIYDETALDNLERMHSGSSVSDGEEGSSSTSDGSNIHSVSQDDSNTTGVSPEPSTRALTSSSTQYVVEEAKMTDYMLQPLPALALDHILPGTGAPEHPFPIAAGGTTPVPGLVMAYINSSRPTTATAAEECHSLVARCHGFIRPLSAPWNPMRDSGYEFLSALRSELFHNIITSETDSDSDDELASDTSEEDVIRPDGDFLNSEDNTEASEGQNDSDEDSSDDETSSDDDEDEDDNGDDEESDAVNVGDGDADPESIPSSRTSLGSDVEPVDELNTLMPSGIGGGKYEYFQVTRRPRPFHGHKFVVSEFGAQARQNQPMLPWVPTCADRLRYILNQYLHQSAGVSAAQTQTVKSDFIEEFDTNEVRRLDTLSICVTAKGKVSKVVSWCIGLVSPECRESECDDVNANTAHPVAGDLGNSIPSCQSCPGMFSSGDKECTEDDGTVEVELPDLVIQATSHSIKAPHESLPVKESLSTDQSVPNGLSPTSAAKRHRGIRKLFSWSCCRNRRSHIDIDPIPQQFK